MGSEQLSVASTCRRCRQRLDAATDVEGYAGPTPGAVSICFYCGTVSMFTDDLTLREPTIPELDDVLDTPIVSRVLGRLWDLQLARVVEEETGVRFACGCHTTARAGLFTLEACSATCAAARTIWRMMDKEGKPMALDPEWPAGGDRGR
jgi:hypothetical protein